MSSPQESQRQAGVAGGHALGVLVMPARRPAAWHEALAGECIEATGFEEDQALLPPLQGLPSRASES